MERNIKSFRSGSGACSFRRRGANGTTSAISIRFDTTLSSVTRGCSTQTGSGCSWSIRDITTVVLRIQRRVVF